MQFSFALAAYTILASAATSTKSNSAKASSASASSTSNPDIWFLINTPVSPVAQCSNTVLTWQEGNLDDKTINIDITNTETSDLANIVSNLPMVPTSYKWLVQQAPGTYYLTVTGAIEGNVYSGNFTISKGSTDCVGKAVSTNSSSAKTASATTTATTTVTAQPNSGSIIVSSTFGYLSWVMGLVAFL